MGAGDDFTRSRLVGLHRAGIPYLVSSSYIVFNPNEIKYRCSTLLPVQINKSKQILYISPNFRLITSISYSISYVFKECI